MAWRCVGVTALGALFLALQIYSWAGLYQDGLTLRSGAYGAMFYTLTTFHALHVAVGIVALGVLSWKGFRGVYTLQDMCR